MTMLLVLLSLGVAPVPAPETEIERGRSLIVSLQEEEALEVLAPFRADAGLRSDLRGRALIYTGIALMNLAREPEARQAFREALEADPGASPPSWVSRRVRAEFDQALIDHRLSLALRTPAAPPPPTPRVSAARSRLPLYLGIGAGVLLAASSTSFVVWRGQHRAAQDERVALRASESAANARTWWYGGVGTGSVGLGMLASAVGLQWVFPLE